IPRTLAVTVFGDLDISILDELPTGRAPIESHVITDSQPNLVRRVWQRVAEEVALGRQVFVVCPRIDDKDEPEDIEAEEQEKTKRPLAAAVQVERDLKLNPILAGLRIGLLHGKQSAEIKGQVMQAFTDKELDILVSTTVIEVGVDVPNATTMVILDADRFGISQLHQLRGRVGRGGLPGLALMLTSAEEGSLALDRVRAVASTNDGFKLSEIDLEYRREGDVLGANQSGGASSLKLLRVLKHQDLIQNVRNQVIKLFEADPTLEKHPSLALALEQADKKRADFLTKS
ncbi:MAG: hypothetical protein RIQ88_933, partial [Actinomycetota bacterium]